MLNSFCIKEEKDIVHMRSEVRELARGMGFDELDQAKIVQSVSELARNVIEHADEGMIEVDFAEKGEKKGIRITVKDIGPGIENISKLMLKVMNKSIGETTGLQQVQLLMDEFQIHKLDHGTVVEVTKWNPQVSVQSE